jgi:hypothetical protein
MARRNCIGSRGMAAKRSSSKRRVVARIDSPQGAQLVVTETAADRAVKWGWRIGIVVAAVFTASWWAFGQWNRIDGYDKRIETVQTTVTGLVKSVGEINEHQKTNADSLSRIEMSINKVAKGR